MALDCPSEIGQVRISEVAGSTRKVVGLAREADEIAGALKAFDPDKPGLEVALEFAVVLRGPGGPEDFNHPVVDPLERFVCRTARHGAGGMFSQQFQ